MSPKAATSSTGVCCGPTAAGCSRTSFSRSPSTSARRRYLLRDGFVTDEFVDLARTENRTAEQEHRLDELKARLAQRVMATPAAEVFDVADD